MTIFERIINKEIPAYILYEDDLVMSFLDISQTTIGHTLVITKTPYDNILEIPNDIFKHLMGITHKITKAINKAFKPKGINLVNNNGVVAGQSVFHYHFHIIPRYNNDSFEISFKNNANNTTKEDYEKRALLIREALL